MAFYTVRPRVIPSVMLCVALAVPGAAHAQAALFADPLTSNPNTGSTDIPVNRGKKGLLYRFKYQDAGGLASTAGFPMSLTQATVTLTISTNAPISCTAGTTAPPNACVFSAADGDTEDGVLDYVEIRYGSDFPVNVTVQYEVQDARSSPATGSLLQDPANTVVSFTTTSSTTPPPVRTPGIVALVFDISGSMGARATPSGSRTRMEVLKTAAEQFFAMLPMAVVEGDKLGAVYFASNATPSAPTLIAAHNEAQRLQLLNDIKSRVPTSATSMGAGLVVAQPILSGDPAPRKYVLLFSDGEQNQRPCIGVPDSAWCNSTLDNSLIVGGAPYTVASVCPVMAGQMSAPGWILQQRIGAIACENNSLKIRDGSDSFADADMQTFFAQILTKVFPGDKLEKVLDVTGTLAPNGTGTQRFFAGPRDISMTISVTWTGGGSGHQFTLRAPDGTMIDLSKRFDFGNGITTARLKLPVIQNNTLIPTSGEWEIGFASGPRGPSGYHALVLLDNEILSSEFRVATRDAGTGEPITLEVHLTEDGAPVTGAIVGVQVSGPQQGLGQMLATTPMPAGSPPASSDPYRDDAARKVAMLANDPAYANLFADQTLPGMSLLDDGTGGDVTANDGIYTGRLAATTVEGHYQFHFSVRASTTRNGDFQRSWKSVTFVRAKPDANNTVMTVLSSTPQAGAVLHVIQVTPKDRFGSLLGPGYAGYMDIVPSAGTIVTPLIDRLDGSYEVTVRVPAGQANPTIDIAVLGTPVASKPLVAVGATLPSRIVSLHAGASMPQSPLSSTFDRALSLGVDLEMRIRRPFSIEAYLGHDRFSLQTSGSDFALTHLSLSGKATFGSAMLRPAIEAGVGGYSASGAGSGTHFGWSAGASVQYWFHSTRAADVSYRFRSANGGDWEYATIQAGVRLGF